MLAIPNDPTSHDSGTLGAGTPCLTFARTIGEKGRVMIPPAIREILGDKILSYRGRGKSEILLLSEVEHDCIRGNITAAAAANGLSSSEVRN